MSDNNENCDPERTPEPQVPLPAEGGDPTEYRELLKKDLVRLTPEQKAQYLAELPPIEEQERMYREMQENGGLSFEEFCASLGLEVHPVR